jgi:CHAT domain-containing protein
VREIRGLPLDLPAPVSPLSETQITLLLAPVLEALPSETRSLWISPDGALASIPWEAIRLKDGTFLGDRYHVRYIENLTALKPRPLRRVPASLLAFGGIDYGGRPDTVGSTQEAPVLFTARGGTERWVLLPGTVREAEAVAALFQMTHPGADVQLLKGTEASRASFQNLAGEVGVIHLATHGFVAPEDLWSLGDVLGHSGIELTERQRAVGYDRGLLSGIVFAGANLPPENSRDAGVLTASELAGMDLTHCELAVLSACETNVGPRYFGEAMTGLNRALQLAGARNTITSLWKVDDQGTADFFQAFYTALWRDGITVPEAFQSARRKVREMGYGLAVWAGFVLYAAGG